jgi:hypothetical protein
MFAAMVEGLSLLIRLNVTMPLADRPSRPPSSHRARGQAEHHRRTMPDLAYGKTASRTISQRRAERERRLLVEGGGLREDLAADRGDDRQGHDREHDARGEDRLAGRGGGAGEERQPADVLLEPLVDGDQLRAEEADAPEAVDDARDGGEQVDRVAEALADPARRQ